MNQSVLSLTYPHTYGYCILVGDGACNGGLQPRPMLRARCITWRARQRCQRQWRAFTRSIHTIGGVRQNFAYVWGFLRSSRTSRAPPIIFAYVPANFCVRPSKILRTSQQNRSYVPERPRIIVRTSQQNFAYVPAQFCVRPSKKLRTSRYNFSEVPHDRNKFLACAQEDCCCSPADILRAECVHSWGWRDCRACIFVIGSAALGL